MIGTADAAENQRERELLFGQSMFVLSARVEVSVLKLDYIIVSVMRKWDT